MSFFFYHGEKGVGKGGTVFRVLDRRTSSLCSIFLYLYPTQSADRGKRIREGWSLFDNARQTCFPDTLRKKVWLDQGNELGRCNLVIVSLKQVCVSSQISRVSSVQLYARSCARAMLNDNFLPPSAKIKITRDRLPGHRWFLRERCQRGVSPLQQSTIIACILARITRPLVSSSPNACFRAVMFHLRVLPCLGNLPFFSLLRNESALHFKRRDIVKSLRIAKILTVSSISEQ